MIPCLHGTIIKKRLKGKNMKKIGIVAIAVTVVLLAAPMASAQQGGAPGRQIKIKPLTF